MPYTGVTFNGKYIVHPGAYSAVNANNLSGSSSSGKNIVLIGSATGGKPNTLHWFSIPQDALNTMKGGNLITAGNVAWAPSGDGVGAGTIGMIRVENAVQSQLVEGILTLKSKDYGVDTNKLQASLQDGTLANSKKLVVYYWPDNTNETYDNIGPVLSIQYKGTDAYAAVTVTTDGVTGKATTLEIKTGVAQVSATTNLSYDLTTGQFPTISALVADINAHANYSASVVTVGVGKGAIASTELDAISNQDILTAYSLTAYKGDLTKQMVLSSLVDLTFTGTGALPSSFTMTQFTGGADGVIPTDWTSFTDLLIGEAVDIVVPLTGDASIHAEVQQFVENQSTNERSEMRGFYGGELDGTIADTILRSVTLNSSRATLCYPGISLQDSNGGSVTYAPWLTAAMIAGRVAGLSVGESCTLNSLNLIGLEKVLTSSEITKLIEAGVTVVEFVRNRSSQGFRVAEGVTTYQDNSNPVFTQISTGMLADDLSKDLREYMEKNFVGKGGTSAKVALALNCVQSFLDQKVRDNWLVAYDASSVSVVLNGRCLTISYSAQPVEEIDFVLITTNFYSESLSAASAS
jgi:hypothetical protein